MAAGWSGMVDDISAGRRARERLVALGLHPGRTLRVVRNDGRGPIIIALGEARLALGRGLAMRVSVRGGPIRSEEEVFV
jgi:ferrous iron transport protein A